MTEDNIHAIVRAFEDQYAAAFNRRDAMALARLLTDDVTIVTEWGDLVAGAAVFVQGLERAFAVVPKELQIENTPRHTVALTPEVIVSHGTTRKVSRTGEEEEFVYTRVLVRQGEGWRLAANHVAQPSKLPDPRAKNGGGGGGGGEI